MFLIVSLSKEINLIKNSDHGFDLAGKQEQKHFRDFIFLYILYKTENDDKDKRKATFVECLFNKVISVVKNQCNVNLFHMLVNNK